MTACLNANETGRNHKRFNEDETRHLAGAYKITAPLYEQFCPETLGLTIGFTKALMAITPNKIESLIKAI